MNIIEVDGKIEPILKWPGGKQDELAVIVPTLPDTINHYYEPFLGGGAVYLTIPPDIPAFVNDKSTDLITLYRAISNQDSVLFDTLYFIIDYWQSLETIIADSFDFLREKFYAYRQRQMSEEIYETVDQFIALNAGRIKNPLELCLPVDTDFYVTLIQDSLSSKIKRMSDLERKKGQLSSEDIQDNLEGALKAAFYYYMRHLYNCANKFALAEGQNAAIFFFVRENAYASMFRFNKKGDFNIPYGGISYNRKNLGAKIERFKNPFLQARLANTKFGNVDFADFLAMYPPAKGDFIFLDPPYDTEFSSYDNNPFGQLDQERLADFLINQCAANFMLVIKSTPFILSLYQGNNLNMYYFDKKYMYTVKERNNRDATHLLIRNY